MQDADARPDSNNCYGHIVAPMGIAALAKWSEQSPFSASVYTSGYDGTRTLQVRAPGLDLETDPLDGGKHLFTGAVSLGPVGSESLRRASVVLQCAGVRHRLELYVPGFVPIVTAHPI